MLSTGRNVPKGPHITSKHCPVGELPPRWDIENFQELSNFIMHNPRGLALDKVAGAPLTKEFKDVWRSHTDKGEPVRITDDIIMTVHDLSDALNVEMDDVPAHIRAHKVERALWREELHHDVEVRTYFFFDERKQQFTAADGVKASTVCALYFDRPNAEDGVRGRVRAVLRGGIPFASLMFVFVCGFRVCTVGSSSTASKCPTLTARRSPPAAMP